MNPAEIWTTLRLPTRVSPRSPTFSLVNINLILVKLILNGREGNKLNFAAIHCGVLHRNSRTSARTKKSIKQNTDALKKILKLLIKIISKMLVWCMKHLLNSIHDRKQNRRCFKIHSPASQFPGSIHKQEEEWQLPILMLPCMQQLTATYKQLSGNRHIPKS